MLSEAKLVKGLKKKRDELGSLQLAAALGLKTESTLNRWIRTGHIPFKDHRSVNQFLSKGQKK